ncbi:MAG: YkgJ family cysteine cluster protein [Deltaproteobacteria bacterium]|nr:YkgJ family cysteine cluster protein [Deltaproteobacteria bacterium]
MRETEAKREAWLAAGLRFECQGSGRCCTSRGEHGFVYLSLADRRRLARHLELATGAFTRRYCEKSGGLFHLKAPEQDCRFLEGGRCSVYEARPEQCRAWPFWSENLEPGVWEREVAAFCPGAGKGPCHDRETVLAIAASAEVTNYD